MGDEHCHPIQIRDVSSLTKNDAIKMLVCDDSVGKLSRSKKPRYFPARFASDINATECVRTQQTRCLPARQITYLLELRELLERFFKHHQERFGLDLGGSVGFCIVAQPPIGGSGGSKATETTEYKDEFGSRFLDDHLDVLQIFRRGAKQPEPN